MKLKKKLEEVNGKLVKELDCQVANELRVLEADVKVSTMEVTIAKVDKQI